MSANSEHESRPTEVNATKEQAAKLADDIGAAVFAGDDDALVKALWAAREFATAKAVAEVLEQE